MAKDKIYMLVATFTRMGMGLIIFVLVARFLGPAQFGIFATAMAYSGILGLISDFGMGTYALRQAGAEPSNAAHIVWQAMVSKMAVTLPLSLLAGAALWFAGPTAETALVYCLIYLALTLAAMADLAFVAARANSRFDIEAFVVVITSALSLAIIVVVAMRTHDLLDTTLAFFATRLIYFIWTFASLRAWILVARRGVVSLSSTLSELKRATTYAIDNLMTNLSSQIDVIMISLFMSAHSVGIYQAGARLVQGIAPFSVMLSLVYLPKLSRAFQTDDKSEFLSLARRLNLEMFAIGILGFLGFIIVGPLWTSHIYGETYTELSLLWPGFACFVLLRFAAAAYGIQLVAMGEMRVRIGAQVLATISIMMASLVLLYTQKLIFSPWMLVISSFFTFSIYSFKIAQDVKDRFIVLSIFVSCVFLCLSSVVYLFYWLL